MSHHAARRGLNAVATAIAAQAAILNGADKEAFR
jgi:hypothetical protein